jgi:hypothetical protein
VSTADDIARMVLAGADEGLLLAAKAVLEEAQRNIPVGDPDIDPDPSVTLKDSGHVEIVENPLGTQVRVSFDTPYAARVHENLRMQHPRGGGAHYLTNALTTVMPTLDNIVAAKVDAETATGKLSDPRRSHHRRRR